MKKQLSVIVGALAILATSNAYSETNWGTRSGSSVNLSSAPSTRTRENINYKKYQTTKRTYTTKDSGDLYYTKPANRSALYKEYTGTNSSRATETKTTVRKVRSETARTTAKRKYFLAHPFFQPLGGKFGSITDLSYTNSSYDFTMNQTVPFYDNTGTPLTPSTTPLSDQTASWTTKQLVIKEDFSYGITDRFAILGMLQYNSSDYETEYNDPTAPKDKMSDSGLNLYGLGVQWRFVDNDQWIAMASGYFQHQKDIANNFILEAKAGYKVQRSTIYGLARSWYIDLEGNSYGNAISGVDSYGNPSMFYLPYQVGDTNAMYLEGGLGVFSVLNQDWTLNVEAVLGNYDWHNQASVKAAIAWQPNDWFALNLYGRTSVYDTANDKTLDLYFQDSTISIDDGKGGKTPLTGLTKIGTADLDKYSEMTIGLQAIFQF